LGRTPLFIAARKGNIELCRLLIAAGADIAVVDIHNFNCLRATLGSRKWGCAEYLLSIVECYEPDGLVEILSTCDYEGLNCLIYYIVLESEIPPDLADRFLSLYITAGLLNASNASGVTPLDIAISFRSTGWIRALLDAGADPGIPDTISWWTPTFMAAFEPLRLSMNFLKLIMDSGKYTEDLEELMGWTAGATIFWL
jgi:ankyrin repeat protein